MRVIEKQNSFIIYTPAGIEPLNPFAIIKTFFIFLFLYLLIIGKFWGNQGRATHLIIYRRNKAYDFLQSLPDIPDSLYYLISGFILGKGGTMYKHKGGNNNRMFRLSNTNLTFLIWVASLFVYRGLATGTINLRKGTNTFEFKTYYIDYITYLYDRWYPNGIFAVPNYVFEEFNPIILAAWFMLSGSSKGNQLRLSSGNLTLDEINKIIIALDNKLGLKTKVIKNGKGIAILDRQAATDLIIPYIHSSQMYRLYK